VSTRVAITHRIEQHFARPVRLSTHWLRLRPAPEQRAQIAAFSLAVDAEPHFLNWVRDPFENHLARLDFPEPLAGLGITLELIAELEPTNPFDFLAEPYAAEHPFEYPVQLKKELSPYRLTSAPGPRLSAWLANVDRTSKTTLERLDELTRMVQEAHALAVDAGPGAVDLERFLERGKGSCWEFAWLLTVTLRHVGLAARFVCGYRLLLADESGGSTPRFPDTVTLHTWSEAYIPGAGWIGLDPAAGIFITETYIPLACAPEPVRVLPIVGDREPCVETRSESLRVRRLTPAQASWPHTDTQRADIDALGRFVDEDLALQGLKPALGVSLSFVSRQDGMAPEWSTQALGPSKRLLAESLSVALWKRLGHGGVPQLGQGEWYGGESLPRWRLGCFFRADGEPVWRNPERLSFGHAQRTAGPDQAQRLVRSLARGLGIDPARVVAAHEDPLHELWRARAPGQLPAPQDLRDPLRRRALAERLSSAHRTPTGFLVPLGWDHARACWVSGNWRFRRSGIYLAPGSASMGYRLPLDGLIDDEAGVLEAHIERCPFEERGKLPDFHAGVRSRHDRGPTEPSTRDGRPPRTALCVEARAGELFVFLPPVSHLEHYLELVAAVEVAAEALKLPVSLEGYEPPEDPRLRRFLLEPDAGVLRLNLPETSSWDEQLSVISAAYEEAWRLDLNTERVSADDGRRVPSGGGGRLTVGGVSPAESPFLTRPEILRSLIAYWQRHPCLSYLFAGRLIGPSGSAPRPDEGRDEILYELSIALEHLRSGTSDKPWLADRVLRHLLTDPAGNLKRAEIRIDQLYAPERASLRLGRILINAFESAPEARLAALQSLLVLGLIGRFGRHPDSGELRRWGPALHDQFLLPEVLWADLRIVVADLAAARYPFQLDWFEPLFELRFPVLGSVPIGPLMFKLRSAHEPWPLLAEEVTRGGVARFIDAANERLQVTLSGAHPGRYVLACNGHRVPLQRTPTHGEYVAGVRYKVSNPPSTMHPTVSPVEGLVFDVIDTWTGHAIGGCTYLAPQPRISGPIGTPTPAPPTGEPREGPRFFPVPFLSMQAMGKSGRFLPRGSGVGKMAAPPRVDDEQFPYLLDLTHRV
jgi:uncharacterized protein (DUF2126 family)/transglutaminase-like putative cysteine protease